MNTSVTDNIIIDNNQIDNDTTSAQSSEASILIPIHGSEEDNSIQFSIPDHELDDPVFKTQYLGIINEKNEMIDRLTDANKNYSKMIFQLNDIITNIRSTVNNELELLKNQFFKEELDILKNENELLEKELSKRKENEEFLLKELRDSDKSYNILNRAYVKKTRDIITLKNKYVESLINLKKTNQNMIMNLSVRIDDLQYKLKDKQDEICISCRVCYSKPINILLKPCNHLIMCKHCIVELSEINTVEFKCPLCQVDITDFCDVYLPE